MDNETVQEGLGITEERMEVLNKTFSTLVKEIIPKRPWSTSDIVLKVVKELPNPIEASLMSLKIMEILVSDAPELRILREALMIEEDIARIMSKRTSGG